MGDVVAMRSRRMAQDDGEAFRPREARKTLHEGVSEEIVATVGEMNRAHKAGLALSVVLLAERVTTLATVLDMVDGVGRLQAHRAEIQAMTMKATCRLTREDALRAMTLTLDALEPLDGSKGART